MLVAAHRSRTWRPARRGRHLPEPGLRRRPGRQDVGAPTWAWSAIRTTASTSARSRIGTGPSLAVRRGWNCLIGYAAGPRIGLIVPTLLVLGNKDFGISSNLRKNGFVNVHATGRW